MKVKRGRVNDERNISANIHVYLFAQIESLRYFIQTEIIHLIRDDNYQCSFRSQRVLDLQFRDIISKIAHCKFQICKLKYYSLRDMHIC